ncbi:MAG: hypothetical protein ACRBFS_03045 [Aureispira sp.]
MSSILIILALAIVGVLTFFLVGFLRNVQPTGEEVEKDLVDLKKSVAQFKGGFMPWTEEMSPKQMEEIMDKGQKRSGNGVFVSKSGDPIFAYAFRKYIGPGRNAVLYILSMDQEYIFRMTNKGTEISIDGTPKGLIRENGILYDTKNDEVAQLKRYGASSINKIFIGEEEVAKIALPDAIANKAVEVTKMDLSPLEQESVRTIAIYDLIENMIKD